VSKKDYELIASILAAQVATWGAGTAEADVLLIARDNLAMPLG